jgi:hypothetical protein
MDDVKNEPQRTGVRDWRKMISDSDDWNRSWKIPGPCMDRRACSGERRWNSEIKATVYYGKSSEHDITAIASVHTFLSTRCLLEYGEILKVVNETSDSKSRGIPWAA